MKTCSFAEKRMAKLSWRISKNGADQEPYARAESIPEMQACSHGLATVSEPYPGQGIPTQQFSTVQPKVTLDTVTESPQNQTVEKFKTMGMNFLQGGAILLAGSIFFFYKSVFTIYDGFDSHSWPSVDGEVVDARVESRRIPGSTREEYDHYFEYIFSVDGKKYSSGRLNFFSVSGDPSEGVEKYEMGQKVQVYYDPNDPSRAVLEPGLPGIFVWLALGFGIILFIGFVSLTFFGDFGALFSRFARS